MRTTGGIAEMTIIRWPIIALSAFQSIDYTADEGAIYLANSQKLSGLYFLNVAGNKLSPKGEDALQKSTVLTNLKILEIV